MRRDSQLGSRSGRAPSLPRLLLLVGMVCGSTVGGCTQGESPDAEAAAEDPPVQQPVRVGLDRVAAGEIGELRGLRLGLVVHGPSQTHDGRHAIDVVRDGGFDLVRLFSPEHGLDGRAAAGEEVADGVDPGSGLPIVSFYGPRRAPEAEHLADLDALVIDLQDVGVRFYTYVSTMLLSAEAALSAGLDVVVLDRPNPLGGELISGPVREDEVPLSMVSRAPGTLVHGMTMGEIARFAYPHALEASAQGPARLRVVTVDGWRRPMIWSATGWPWRLPSPNLRSFDAAVLYPATAMLESTNVSEGRGTDAPFLVIGAPWWSSELQAELVSIFEEAGFEAVPERFRPLSSPAAPQPKHLNADCVGLRLALRGAELPTNYDPYALGLRVLRRLQTEDGFEWRRGGEALTWLLGAGSPLAALRQAEVAPTTLDDHLATVSGEVADWRERRRSALLY